MNIFELIQKEGWEVREQGGRKIIHAHARDFNFTHPAVIHLKLYAQEKNPDIKYHHLKAAHDYLWPHHALTWNYWTERRFREHCGDWKVITYAGGANIGKSFDAAKLAIMFWLANPRHRTVMVMSTTLEALNSRIYGYVTRLITDMKVELPFVAYGGNNPRIGMPKERNKPIDKLHCIVAVAAKKGDTETAISSLIGRHPDEGLFVIADECTDLPITILSAIPNLETVPTFQLLGIGNSNSKFDLHGSLSTPEDGWGSVSPLTHNRWKTTQERGICLYFSPYESPAIHETDPERKAALSRFLMTQDEIEAKKKLYGEKSDSFWRFCLGYWRDDAADETVLSGKFLSEFNIKAKARWTGLQTLNYVAGLDVAYSTGGDQVVLRLAALGENTDGKIILDYKGDDLVFRVPIIPSSDKSPEIQIADFVIEKFKYYGIGMDALAVDATGQGRAIAEVIRLRAGSPHIPFKIYSTASGTKQVKSFDVVIKTTIELWTAFRDYIQHDQIRGLDDITVYQLTSRLVKVKNGKQILETKTDYKQRMGAILPSMARSPDEADAAALCLQAAILRYGFSKGQRTFRQPNTASEFVSEKYAAWQKAEAQRNTAGVVESPSASFGVSLEDSFSELMKPPFS